MKAEAEDRKGTATKLMKRSHTKKEADWRYHAFCRHQFPYSSFPSSGKHLNTGQMSVFALPGSLSATDSGVRCDTGA